MKKTLRHIIFIVVALCSLLFVNCKNDDDEIKSTSIESLCPDGSHPHAIDLGIGVKFACCNVGASSPDMYGDFYAWGETETKSNFSWQAYQHCTIGIHGYVTMEDIGSDIAGTSNDVANVKWKNGWRMPNSEQLEMLVDKCKSRWTTVNGINGRLFIGPNGNRIFLPAAGIFEGVRQVLGFYWSSSLYDEKSLEEAKVLVIDDGKIYGASNTGFASQTVNEGCTVRPVME